MFPASQGKVLEVDLTTGAIDIRELPEGMLRAHLGGSGLVARMLYDELDPGLDPLAPEAPLVFMNGLLVGTTVACCNKACVCARSPLTGIWGEARAGGYWGAELARAGWGGIVVRGQAAEPVYLWISDGQTELRPAGEVWGKDTIQSAERLQEATDPRLREAGK